MASDTPLMRQYEEIKKQHTDKVLFFRLGDFYEMFDSDAVEVSSLLNLTLTHRGDQPMCGIPYHAAKNYIKRLLDYGKKIAICEQIELGSSPKSLAKRQVIQIVTPATVVEEDFLDEKSFNYLFAVFQSNCSFCDVSTGDFHLRTLDPKNRLESLRSALEQIKPREILVCEDEYFLDKEFRSIVDSRSVMVTKLPPWYFTVKNGYSILCEHAGVSSLSAYGIGDKEKILQSAGCLLRYLKETSHSSVVHMTDYQVDHDNAFVALDESSRRNLELFNNLSDGSSHYTLFETMNRCKTSGGNRLLKSFISFPLRSAEKIAFRQQWVKFFVENPAELSRVRNCISSAMDMNRLVTRVLMKKAVPHDLVGIMQTIGVFFDIMSADFERYATLLDAALDEDKLKACSSFMERIHLAINDRFLGQFNEGEVILSGYDAVLDDKRAFKDHSDDKLKDFLAKVKAETGLSIIKLGYSRIIGYYLEVPNGQVSRVPQTFMRKQTLVNGERFTTAELVDYEQQILKASSDSAEREKELYNELLDQATGLVTPLNSMGRFLNLLDVFQSLAVLATDSSYTCPEITTEDVLQITGGRHPVVEKQLGPGLFVSNDLDMNVRFNLITGPNMAGKSTYLRQNALIILMAHMGSFVPAQSAVIGITDKIFCRVGAMDNLARGESTFMVEMQEAAFILRTCTRSSFVIIDEIGRGTSTQDGMSIAYAIMKNLIQRGPKTLFATHYHELTMMDTSDIRLLTLEVSEEGQTIRFLRRICPGVANSSYGLHVARLAGIPASVVREATVFQNRHFADYSMKQGGLFTQASSSADLPPLAESEVEKELRDFDIESCTPVQALIELSRLKEKIT